MPEAPADDYDIGAHAEGHGRSAASDHAAAEDDNVGRRDALDAAEQNSAPAVRSFEEMRGHLRRHASGNLRHRSEQGQLSARIRHGFIGDGGDAGGHEIVGLLGIGREVQIGEDHLAAFEFASLSRKRLLDLHDQLGSLKYLVGGCDKLRPRCGVLIIADAGAVAGRGFDRNGVTVFHQFGDRRRNKPDAVFVRLDLFRNADEHRRTHTGPHILRDSMNCLAHAGHRRQRHGQ